MVVVAGIVKYFLDAGDFGWLTRREKGSTANVHEGALFHGRGIHALVGGSEGDPVVVVDARREFVKDIFLIPAQIGGGDAASEMFGAHGFHSACDQFWLDVPHQGGELGHAIFHWGTGEQQRILALCDH